MDALTTLLRQIALAYDRAEHDPYDLDTERAYGALKLELWAQFTVLAEFVDVEFVDADPYADHRAMFRDLIERETPTLRVWRVAELPKGHPLADHAPNGETFNSIFRAVHDGYAHRTGVFSFGERGEFGAMRAHMRSLSALARWALFTETTGQSAASFYGRYAPDFGPQKACLLPHTLLDAALALSFGEL